MLNDDPILSMTAEQSRRISKRGRYERVRKYLEEVMPALEKAKAHCESHFISERRPDNA